MRKNHIPYLLFVPPFPFVPVLYSRTFLNEIALEFIRLKLSSVGSCWVASSSNPGLYFPFGLFQQLLHKTPPPCFLPPVWAVCEAKMVSSKCYFPKLSFSFCHIPISGPPHACRVTSRSLHVMMRLRGQHMLWRSIPFFFFPSKVCTVCLTNVEYMWRGTYWSHPLQSHISFFFPFFFNHLYTSNSRHSEARPATRIVVAHENHFQVNKPTIQTCIPCVAPICTSVLLHVNECLRWMNMLGLCILGMVNRCAVAWDSTPSNLVRLM